MRKRLLLRAIAFPFLAIISAGVYALPYLTIDEQNASPMQTELTEVAAR